MFEVAYADDFFAPIDYYVLVNTAVLFSGQRKELQAGELWERTVFAADDGVFVWSRGHCNLDLRVRLCELGEMVFQERTAHISHYSITNCRISSPRALGEEGY